MSTKDAENSMLISYMLLRKLIGCMGILLPVALASGGLIYANCTSIQSSISDYYHTEMRNLLVGTLCAVALFMFAYKGHDKRDKIAGNLACIFALGVAFFPTKIDVLSECTIGCIDYKNWITIVHFTSAFFFFTVLIYFSLVLFPQTHKTFEPLSNEKKNRNKVYKICGFTMIACIVCIAIYILFFKDDKNLQQLDPIFWLETIALLAFGLSWLTKGQFLFEDKSI